MPRNNTSPRKPQADKPRSARRSEWPGSFGEPSPGRPRRAHQVRVRSTLRREPDVRRIAQAVIELALAEAEHDAGLPRDMATPPSSTVSATEHQEVSS